ncbi:antimicrobial ginkbilobin-2-like protein, partial [Euphorbia lathyris]|uniref:antimicrobial ginkbilobin-2-like protein n=1 Tax=Euphorbia lathyris TaxID=212925 RepID=UPI003313236B
ITSNDSDFRFTNINGDYQKSLNNLIYTFQNLAPANSFALGSVGQNIQDRPFSLSLCRGDISGTNCTSCIAEARSEIRKLCPYNKAATIWYDNCLLKYSDNEGSSRIYGLAQCSRDLVRDDCYKCLNGAIAEIPNCCDGKQGGRVVVGASCTVRYEIYTFLKPY